MPVIGVTGGIASGKSTVTRKLGENLAQVSGLRLETFSADDCGHELLKIDSFIRNEIVKVFGSSVLDTGGSIDRRKLREVVFADESLREQLELILHPRINSVWKSAAALISSSNHYLVAEIPLLYETGNASSFDCVIAVEAGAQIQIERLSSKRGWSLETARRVIEAQFPAAEKMRRADILILNQHTEILLCSQIELAAKSLLLRYV